MTQDAERTSRDCPVCRAARGAMCVGATGQTELEVHRERPYWSSSVRMMVLPQPAVQSAAHPAEAAELKGFVTKLTPDHVLDRLIQAGPGQTLYGAQ